jgi:hypothetical protein
MKNSIRDGLHWVGGAVLGAFSIWMVYCKPASNRPPPEDQHAAETRASLQEWLRDLLAMEPGTRVDSEVNQSIEIFEIRNHKYCLLLRDDAQGKRSGHGISCEAQGARYCLRLGMSRFFEPEAWNVGLLVMASSTKSEVGDSSGTSLGKVPAGDNADAKRFFNGWKITAVFEDDMRELTFTNDLYPHFFRGRVLTGNDKVALLRKAGPTTGAINFTPLVPGTDPIRDW